VTAFTKERIASFAVPSFHDGSGSAAYATEQRKIKESAMNPESTNRNVG
jgi:hypothetical protein